jgi:hypothetical protein
MFMTCGSGTFIPEQDFFSLDQIPDHRSQIQQQKEVVEKVNFFKPKISKKLREKILNRFRNIFE